MIKKKIRRMKMRVSVIGESEKIEGQLCIKVNILKLYNSFLLLITDQEEFGIGTVSLSSPPNDINPSASSTPSNIFGLKNNILSNLVSKTASSRLKKPVISLIFIKESNLKPKFLTRTVIDALNIALDKINI